LQQAKVALLGKMARTREASGATDAEAKRLGRKSEPLLFMLSLIARKRKITLMLRLSI
jgi:hypothetical protein